MPAPDVYDPVDVFVDVFSAPGFAADLAFALTCREINVLVGLLDSRGRPDAAVRWLNHHLDDCGDAPRHQH